MSANRLDELRKEVDQVNLRLLDLINRRGELIKQIGDIKTEQGINVFDPIREREMLDLILKIMMGILNTQLLNTYLRKSLRRQKN